MYMQIPIRELAKLFSCPPRLADVVEARNKQAKDFSQYTKKLFQDVSLEGLLVDYGYPNPPIPRETFDEITGIRTTEVFRIEPVMDRLAKSADNFNDFITQFRSELRAALQQDHVVGLKSIIAYRSGLEIGDKDEKKAASQYEAFRQNQRAAAKDLRDYCIHVSLEECREADKVMHIHTGVGDGEVVLPKASPGLLMDLLRSYEDTKVHLVHGGYPWMEEAAFIVSVLPNVYMDISLQNPFIGHGVKRIISQVFEFAPFNKVMFGTDAFTVPEMNWLGVKLFKTCFEEVLEEWIAKDYMDAEMAQLIGENVLYRNYEAVYDTQAAVHKS